MPKKIAVCIGQNIYDPSTGVTPLRGCVNDALLIGEMLRFAGFDIIRQVHNEAATQEGILERVSTEVAKLRSGDYFVLWNSSHGYQIQDRSGDELIDGLDEAITSYDTDPRNPLTDDKFAQIISRAHPQSFILFASDSCHSGTLSKADVAHLGKNYRVPRLWIPPDDVLFRTGKPMLDLGKYMKGIPSRKAPKLKLRNFGRLGKDTGTMNHLFLSGCLPEEVSWDAKFDEGFHGAMTYNFTKAVLNAWSKKKAISYAEAHKTAIQGLKKGKFQQSPQLEGQNKFKDSPVFGVKF